MFERFSCAAVMLGVLLSSGIGQAKDPSAKKLKKAPTRVAVAGAVLQLKARLWRDSATLRAALDLETSGGEALPAGLEVNRVWLIRRKEVWSPAEVKTEVQMTEPGKPRTTMKIQFENGPAWKPGTKVICVLRIELLDGREGMVRADKTAIAASQ